AIKASNGIDRVAEQIVRIISFNEDWQPVLASTSSICSTEPLTETKLIYVGAIKGMVGDYADEIHLHVKLGSGGEYLFYNDGCGLYGYLCWVPFGRIFSKRLFAVCYYKRITEMPLEHRLYGGSAIVGDERFVAWEQIKDTRVDNIHFDMFTASGATYDQVVSQLRKALNKGKGTQPFSRIFCLTSRCS
ncbi:MAG: hypothetical protein HY761_04620, partial [Candidatus Omnitrophica bacterium]|nr:hypothetical protein [Candidatus Omnitrophota bacterium]